MNSSKLSTSTSAIDSSGFCIGTWVAIGLLILSAAGASDSASIKAYNCESALSNDIWPA